MNEERRTDPKLEDLITGHFDGTLTEDEEKELAKVLKESVDAKQLFLSHMRMEGRLHSLGRDGFLREPVANPVIESGRSTPQSSDIDPPVGSGRRRLRLLAASTSLVACAVVVLMLLSGVLVPSSVSASSVVQKAKKAASELIDRTYHVTLADSDGRSETRELVLNVRGGGAFLLRPVDNASAMGCDGIDYWAVQQNGPVWVTGNRRTLAQKMKRTTSGRWLFGIAASPDEPLLLEMTGLLSLIERRFDVELMDTEDRSEYHVRATSRSGPRNAPERIDFWADADSGVALRAEIRWQDGRQMRFRLAETSRLPEKWYHHSQHAPDRPVRRVGAANSP